MKIYKNNTKCTKINIMMSRLVFWAWGGFLATLRDPCPELARNLPGTCLELPVVSPKHSLGGAKPYFGTPQKVMKKVLARNLLGTCPELAWNSLGPELAQNLPGTCPKPLPAIPRQKISILMKTCQF